jgi:hypothetical protein
MFERRRFAVEIILVVRWHCRYGISYRDLAELMQECRVEVDPSTIMRWVHRCAPELEKAARTTDHTVDEAWCVGLKVYMSVLGDALDAGTGTSRQDVGEVVAYRNLELSTAFDHREDRRHARSSLRVAFGTAINYPDSRQIQQPTHRPLPTNLLDNLDQIPAPK